MSNRRIFRPVVSLDLDIVVEGKYKEILGYSMKVASLEDVVRGKTWVYLDETRQKSKRQKDLADIIRLIESYPQVESQLPSAIRDVLK
jgi:hypothetical protein